MTHRLYYDDSACYEFTARVIAQIETARGPAVCLEATAFYPTGGGQPHDTGFINDILVLDVWSDADEQIWHLLETPLAAGETVVGRVDQARRLRHAQQHTGQHLLSAVALALYQAETVGFHIGSEANTVDLTLPQLSWEAAFHLEDTVNRIIWENRAVSARFVSAAELPELALRREPKVNANIRIVSIAGYDDTPCGGTHVNHTGAIGAVKLTGLERYKGNVRVSFLCGEMALLDYRRAQQRLQALSAALTVGQEALLETVNHLQDELKDARRALAKAQTELRAAEAEQLWQAAMSVDGRRCIVAHWSARAFAEAQALAAALREHPATVALLAVTESDGVRLVCARSDDLSGVDAGALLRAALAPLNGRGGGPSTLARGGAPLAEPDAIVAALRQAAATLLTHNKQ